MKKIMRLLLAAMPLFIFAACGDEDKPTPVTPQKTIAALVSETPDLSLLKVAVVRAGLVETLSKADATFTVFAPTNEAFKAAGLDTEEKINAVPVDDLKKIVLYHVLGKKYMASAIPEGTTELATANELKTYITKSTMGVFVNGTKVTKADIEAKNGVVHLVGKVLMPPAGSIVDVAKANPQLSYLVAAVVRASEGATNVAKILSEPRAYTVFAPTNDAFKAAGFATIDAIKAANPDALAAILTYHVIAKRVFSSDLTEGMKPEMLNKETVTITLAGGPKVKGKNNNAPSNITITDVMATNGVVHVINGVLLP